MNGKGILLVALGLLTAGCAPPVRTVYSEFDEAQYRAALEPGSSEVTGQGFLRTMGGDVKYAAGSRVLMFPDTPHARECIAIHTTQWATSNCDRRVVSLARSTVADGSGRFRFDRVKPGRYYIETSVTWYVPGTYAAQGGSFGRWVTVPEGEPTVEVILTR